jgi:S1-C subfamily serine protease
MEDETTADLAAIPATVAAGAPPATTETPQPTPPGDAGPARPKRRYLRWVALIAVVAAVGIGAFFLGRWVSDDHSAGSNAVSTTTTPAPTGSTFAPGDEPVADVAAALSPSVVQLETRQGLGSGVIYRSDGYILTAAHVVAGADQVTVRLADGTRLDGKVLGSDPGSDVAVVKVEQTGLPVAPTATDVQLRVGQMAIAIGSPWGLDQTVTAGVISSVRRTVTGPDGLPREMIQTDAPVNPGNSGGALADRQGRVIGINDSIFTLSGGSEGVGFAIPIDTATSIAGRLVAGEQIKTALLGVTGTDTTSGQAGALINGVIPDSPADQAGLRVGDLVTGYDGQHIASFADLAAAVRASQPGDRVPLTVQRGDQQITVEVVLAERTDG